MMKRIKRLLSLFLAFAKIGLFTFGGGMAMLPMLEKECVDNHRWVTKEQMLDIYAIGQCTPGIIAVNTATFIGYKEERIIGSVFATLGIVSPSFLIILLVASVLSQFSSNVYVINAFKGVRVVVCALISGSVIKLSKNAIINVEKFIIALCALLLQLFLNVSPIVIVLSVIIYSIIIFFSAKRDKS